MGTGSTMLYNPFNFQSNDNWDTDHLYWYNEFNTKKPVWTGLNQFHGLQKTSPRWSGSVPAISELVLDQLQSMVACFGGKKPDWTRLVNTTYIWKPPELSWAWEELGRNYRGIIKTSIHGLAETFSPGVHSGLNFKIWWTGAMFAPRPCFFHLVLTTLSSGWKGGAPLIQNDHQFGVALATLLKKDKSKVHISVDNDMEGFWIKQVVSINISGISIQLILLNISCLHVSHMQQLLELMKSWCMALE